jgi:hypothetical protein
VHLDGVDTDTQMRNFLSWGSESQHNAYSNFARYLDQEPSFGGPMAPPAYGKDLWVAFTQEESPRFEPRMKFTTARFPGVPMGRAASLDFKIKPEANLQGYGVAIDRLPRPVDEPVPGSLPE